MPGRTCTSVESYRRLIRWPCILQRDIRRIVDPCMVNHGVKCFALFDVAAAKHYVVAFPDFGFLGWWRTDRDVQGGAAAKRNKRSQFERDEWLILRSDG